MLKDSHSTMQNLQYQSSDAALPVDTRLALQPLTVDLEIGILDISVVIANECADNDSKAEGMEDLAPEGLALDLAFLIEILVLCS